MAHAQKPDFVFRRNGRVHLNRRGLQLSRLLAAEVCASAVVMLDTPRSEVVREYWLRTPFASFSFTSPPLSSPCAIRFQKHSTYIDCLVFFTVETEGVPCEVWSEFLCVIYMKANTKCIELKKE